MKASGIVVAFVTFGVLLAEFGHSQTQTVEARRQALNKLIAEEWEYELRESPETATVYGDYRYNNKLTDYSLAHVQQQSKDAEGFLERFKAIDVTGLSDQDQLNQKLMVRSYQEQLEYFKLKNYEMPVDQLSGIQIQLPELVALVPLDSARHYEDYLARLRQIPHLFDQVIEVLRQGEKDGLMPPRFLLEKVVTQCEAIARPAGEANPFGQPVVKFPQDISATEQRRLHKEILAAVDTEVRPAYGKLGKFVREDYAPKGRLEPGVWALPDGDARYRFDIRHQTTTDLHPVAIHQLGLNQVQVIEAQMSAIAKQLGFADLKSFRASLKNNPKLTPTSAEGLLEAYRGYIDQMKPKLPQLFGVLPKAPVEVVAVEAFREKEAPGAEYNPATPDGSRPGKVYVNTGDYQHRSLLDVESTAYHEGVPGHHMQLSIAQEVKSLPPFRQHASYTAYQEGWALYAERLGKDVGFYKDPYSEYGRLSSELLRATRLVLDTGVHFKHWTREQMVTFFREHSDEDEPDLQAETDRYIADPGQALAYKLGQLKFLELRSRAQRELGVKYDVRAFHDQMLNGGALPLDILEARTNAWIERMKASGNAAKTATN